MLFGGEIGKTIGQIAAVGAALVGLKMAIGAILALKGIKELIGAAAPGKAAAGKGPKPKVKMPGIMGTIATVLGIGYLNKFAGSSDEATDESTNIDSSVTPTDTKSESLTTMDKVVAGGVGALGAYSTYRGVQGVRTATAMTKDAILDARTMSVSQLANSKPETKWGKFLAFVAQKNPKLWGKIGLKLAQAGALAAIPIVGWIGAAINLGLGFWTAWQLYELWKEFSGQDDGSDTTPQRVSPNEPVGPIPQQSQNLSPSPIPTSTEPIDANMLDIIGNAEGGKMGYDAINKGKAGDTPNGMPGLSKMSVGDVMKLQQEKKVFAAGRYQIIPTTLEGLVKSGVVKKEDIFDAQTQDKLATELINRRLKRAGDDPLQQQLELSKEFASIANPHTGSSYYDGKGNNKASIASIFTRTPGSTIAASSVAVADGKMGSSMPPVVINSPQTVNNMGQSGSSNIVTASVLDEEFARLLFERAVV